ncbi:tetraspanin-like protein [Encephalitozoon hellem]|uniref:Tetraspanin-like protein n=1 Tax=Encephalitozoon hellem TaxID=27973 RepID=A0ABY8CM17_ENCHE|nr:tetraspanin-like protein [Encephalitozoon hellem]
MHHKSTVKKTFKVVFFFIQALVFISGVGGSIVGTTIYLTAQELLQIPAKILMLSYTIGALEVLSAILGYTALSSRRKLRMLVYISITLVLMNIQAIIAVKSWDVYERSREWGDWRWSSLTENQRNFVQAKFRCCGFYNAADRSGSSCGGENGCVGAVYKLSKSVSKLIQKILMFLFFFESVGVGILSMLRLRK